MSSSFFSLTLQKFGSSRLQIIPLNWRASLTNLGHVSVWNKSIRWHWLLQFCRFTSRFGSVFSQHPFLADPMVFLPHPYHPCMLYFPTFQHRIHGTNGIFTYIDPIEKSTIHVGFHIPFPWILWIHGLIFLHNFHPEIVVSGKKSIA